MLRSVTVRRTATTKFTGRVSQHATGGTAVESAQLSWCLRWKHVTVIIVTGAPAHLISFDNLDSHC